MTGPSCTIEVTNGLGELVRVQEVLDAFAGTCALGDGVRHSLLLIVEELFVNTVRYGYDEGEADMITISVRLLDDGDLRLTIRDQARFFDVSRPPRVPTGEESLEDIQVGGLGLFLVHELAQQILHRRQGNSNVTEIVLPRSGAA